MVGPALTSRVAAAHGRWRRSLVSTALVAGTLCLALGAALRRNYTGTPPDHWFQSATRDISGFPGQAHFHYHVFLVLSRSLDLGVPPLIVVVAGAGSLVVFAARTGRLLERFCVAAVPAVTLALAAGTAELGLKQLIGRRVTGNLGVLTFPSGHATSTAAVAAAVLIGLTLAPAGPTPWATGWPAGVRWAVAAVFVAGSAEVGLAMATLRSHFLTDVVGGWLWGLACACVVWAVAQRVVGDRP